RRAGQERVQRPVQPRAVPVGQRGRRAARLLPQAWRAAAFAAGAADRLPRNAVDEGERLRVRAGGPAGQARHRRAQQGHVTGVGEGARHWVGGSADRHALHRHRAGARRRDTDLVAVTVVVILLIVVLVLLLAGSLVGLAFSLLWLVATGLVI